MDCPICPICMDVVRGPVMIPCDHMFCQRCITRWRGQCWAKGFELSCPVCRYVHRGAQPLTVSPALASMVASLVARHAPPAGADGAAAGDGMDVGADGADDTGGGAVEAVYPWRQLKDTQPMRFIVVDLVHAMVHDTCGNVSLSMKVGAELEGILFADASSIQEYMDITTLRARVLKAYQEMTGEQKRRSNCLHRIKVVAPPRSG
jgi:hypothetical protein